MKFASFIRFAGLSLVMAVAPLANAAIVTNGNFGTGTTPSLSGWTATGTGTDPGIGITAIHFGPGADMFGDNIPMDGSIDTGAYFVDDNANETLSQSITLAANTNYVLTFDLLQTDSGANNPFNFTLSDSVGVLASSSISNSVVPTDVWTQEVLNFTSGAAGTYTLAYNFVANGTPAKDVVLTNVAVTTATPEPSSLLLLGTGVLAAAGAMRRRLLL